MAKIFLIAIDGGADKPSKFLNGETPFESANTPFLDSLSKKGINGLVDIISNNIPAESDSGMMSLLSYDPLKYYRGRGALEGLGAGFLQKEETNNVCFRINFASYSKGILERRTQRDLTNDELQGLTNEIKEEVKLYYKNLKIKFNIYSFGRHRGVISFSGNLPLSSNVSNTDPGFTRVGYFGIPNKFIDNKLVKCTPLDQTTASQNTADIVNLFIEKSHEILEASNINKRRINNHKLPSNFILCRDGGEIPNSIVPFGEKYGKTLSIYGQIPAERGLAMLIGANYVNCSIDEENISKYFKQYIDLIFNDTSDIIAVHILKSSDEAGHEGDYLKKKKTIEMLDKLFIKQLVERRKDDDIIIITCDHATPCEDKIHSADKVPLLINGSAFESDNVKLWGEKNCNKGNLPFGKAYLLFDYIYNKK